MSAQLCDADSITAAAMVHAGLYGDGRAGVYVTAGVEHVSVESVWVRPRAADRL